MLKRMGRITLTLVLIATLVIPPPPARACGPYFSEAIFIQTKHPDLPLQRFAAGDLGIVRPSYARSYLVVAYQYFSGKGLDADEQRQTVALWNHRLSNFWTDFYGDSNHKTKDVGELWIEARQSVAGAENTDEMKGFQAYAKANYGEYAERFRYFEFENCTPNAFQNATDTLRARAGEFGPKSDAVHAWLNAQDTVFLNCRGKDSKSQQIYLPQQAATTLPAKIRADREYQAAAAYFYGRNWNEAEKRFLAIAENPQSPWRNTAALVAVRCRIREATLEKNDPAEQTNELKAADIQLKKLEAQADMKEFTPAIRRLRGFVEYRTDPDGRLLFLANSISSQSSRTTFREDLDDYTKLLDKVAGEDSYDDTAVPPSKNSSERPDELSKLLEKSDLTDWLFTFQTTDQGAADHAYEKWHATKSPAWLVAAISKPQLQPFRRQELIDAADHISPSSKCHLTVAFHRARLLAQAGKTDEARRALDTLLENRSAATPISAQNTFLALRLKLARNFDEFLNFAPRIASAVTTDIDGFGLPLPPESCNYGTPNQKVVCRDRQKPQLLFDSDAARSLTESFPTEFLVIAAENKSLHDALRKQIAQAAWVRSVLLEDDAHGGRAASALAPLAPDLKPGLEEYSSASAADQRRFAAVNLLLRHPELYPEVRAGIGREVAPGDTDSYHNNWWCTRSGEKSEYYAINYYDFYNSWRAPLAELYDAKETRRPAFLATAEWNTAQREWTSVTALGAAPTWLIKISVAFAKAHHEDARVPEALYRAVRASRRGCPDAETGKFSKQAFDLLHSKYPKSEWTKKTPYWYQ